MGLELVEFPLYTSLDGVQTTGQFKVKIRPITDLNDSLWISSWKK